MGITTKSLVNLPMSLFNSIVFLTNLRSYHKIYVVLISFFMERGTYCVLLFHIYLLPGGDQWYVVCCGSLLFTVLPIFPYVIRNGPINYLSCCGKGTYLWRFMDVVFLTYRSCSVLLISVSERQKSEIILGIQWHKCYV